MFLLKMRAKVKEQDVKVDSGIVLPEMVSIKMVVRRVLVYL